MNTRSDLLVVGAGPAGITAALQARELGATVSLLEAHQVGGTTYNLGPAPVRTLARAARLARDWSSWAQFGLAGAPPVPDLAAVLANSQRVARYAHDHKDLAGHLRRHGVDLHEGVGPVFFVSPHRLAAADGRTWSSDKVVIAVGGHAGRLDVPGAELALTYEDLPTLSALPGRAGVIGGADTGCQLASILADFGVAVTLFESGPGLLPHADATVAAELGDAFGARNIDVRTGASVEGLYRSTAGVRLDYRAGAQSTSTTVDAAFCAIGWPANLDGLALEAAGVQADRGAIPVDAHLATNVAHILAAGDVNGHSKLVQTARLEGRVAAHNALDGSLREADYRVVPSASFTDPEYGRVGMTEAEATQAHEVAVGIARYHDLLRPVADGRPEGFCKVVVDRQSHLLLGAHVLGEYAAETVQVVAACMVGGMTVEEVAGLQLAFPTFTEAVAMAAQKVCRELGVGHFPPVWSYLGDEDG